MTNLTQQQAFNLFRQDRLDELAFMPNIEELRQNYEKDGRGVCCRARRAVVIKYQGLFGEAFLEATQ